MSVAETYERLFHAALRIRLVEERIIALYPSDKIQSPVHLSIGQEAVAVGACDALAAGDLVFGTYRGHAFYLAKGGDMRAMFAELYGKATGCGGGKAGSMHLAAPDVGFMGASAVVASTIPHAVGSALAARHRQLDQVALAVFGDGATEQGVYHESLNFAALHRLPVVLLCENNGLAVHSPREARQAFGIAEHARGYGIDVAVCEDGYDFMAVRTVTADAVGKVCAGRGPVLIECKTERYMEHVGIGEDYAAGYRSAEVAAEWKRRDPLCCETELVERWTAEIAAEIDDAVAFAEASPWPSHDALLADVA